MYFYGQFVIESLGRSRPYHSVPIIPPPSSERLFVIVAPLRGRLVVPLKYKHSAFACFPDLISSDAIINCSRPREWSRVDTSTSPPPSALYLQFSFVNNKPWRRRGSDFNEGINNSAERGWGAEGGKRGVVVGRGRGRAGEGRQRGEFKRAYTGRKVTTIIAWLGV